MRDRNPPLSIDADMLAWQKMDGLLPAVVQDCRTGEILMLGYMNREALAMTVDSGRATFYSRSRARLWRKGQTSGNYLSVKAIRADCDSDALLVSAEPAGPTCHLGSRSCFGDAAPDDSRWLVELAGLVAASPRSGDASGHAGRPLAEGPGWLVELSRIIADRAGSGGPASYTRRLLAEGPGRIAQKVGEEGVEVALAGASGDAAQCAEEAADLIYHLAVLMQARGFGWSDVIGVLRRRHAAATQ